MDLIIINIIDGLIYGLLLFMLSSGLTLIFSMMGVLNLSHAAFYMLGLICLSDKFSNRLLGRINSCAYISNNIGSNS